MKKLLVILATVLLIQSGNALSQQPEWFHPNPRVSFEFDWRYCNSMVDRRLAARERAIARGADVSCSAHYNSRSGFMMGGCSEQNQPVTDLAVERKKHIEECLKSIGWSKNY